MNNNETVFVLGLYLPGIDIIRDLRGRGIRCAGLDCIRGVQGRYLRNTQTYICPDPEKDERGWIDFMLSLRKKYATNPLIMVTSDKFLISLHKNSRILKEYFRFCHSEDNIYKKLHDKKTLYELAVKYNMPVPVSIFPDNLEDLRKNLHRLNYPCILKPIYSTNWSAPEIFNLVGWNKVIKAENKLELISWYEKISRYDKELIIQEVVPGPDSSLLYFVSYLNKRQECLYYFCGQKLRITPVHFGSASYMRTVDPSPIKEHCIDFLEKNKYWGPCGIEMKKDERSNIYKLIEINPRFGLWDVIGKKVGIDLYYTAYADLLGHKITLTSPQPRRYYWLSISRDIPCFFEYKREGLLSLMGWIKSFFGKVYFADIYLDEPLLMYHMYIKRMFRKIRGLFR